MRRGREESGAGDEEKEEKEGRVELSKVVREDSRADSNVFLVVVCSMNRLPEAKSTALDYAHMLLCRESREEDWKEKTDRARLVEQRRCDEPITRSTSIVRERAWSLTRENPKDAQLSIRSDATRGKSLQYEVEECKISHGC